MMILASLLFRLSQSNTAFLNPTHRTLFMIYATMASSESVFGIGEAASLGTAALWATASLLYGKLSMSAWKINLGKNIVASLVILAQLSIVALVMNQPVFSCDPAAWGWLSLSGLVGIVLGDTFFFRSLQILGPRLALLTALATPVFGGLLGWVLLGEALHVLAIGGIGVTLAGVVWVVSERTAQNESPGLKPGSVVAGITFGLIGAVCQAGGGVASTIGMREHSCSPIEATFIRLAFSAVLIAFVMLCGRRLKDSFKEIFQKHNLRFLLPACFMGTYLGIWFSQIGYKHTSIAVATTLMSTCPLFAIPLVVIFLKQRVSFRAIVGTIITILGVCLLTLTSNSQGSSASEVDKIQVRRQVLNEEFKERL
jgi:drug/metabolite transporter (DMT)-like permease